MQRKDIRMYLIFVILGAACALLGLAEVSRLVVRYCSLHEWEAKFYLELTAYVIGAVWITYQLFKEAKDHI